MSNNAPTVAGNNHAKREQDTIEIAKALLETGFEESDFDKAKKERVFKKAGFNDFRISTWEGRVSYGTFQWTGKKYPTAATFIRNLLTQN